MLKFDTIKVLLAACTLLAPCTVQADTVWNVAVSGVGVQGSQMYIISSDLPAACGDAAYLALTNSAYNAGHVMAVALSSRVSGKPLARVDFTVGSPCVIDLIQL